MDSFNIDHQRVKRLGFPEVIYGAEKSTNQLLGILKNYFEREKNSLITKVQKEKALVLLQSFPQGFYDEESGVFMLSIKEPELTQGEVAILSGGTSDMFVVNEAYYTLKYLGVEAERIADVGVSGLHRLINRLEDIVNFQVLIVVAGFEGTLPTVVGGLLPQPIIAVPTDVGYGVASDGHTALNTMLASCANGISVVNINNGYGAAMAAFRILRYNRSQNKNA